MARFTLALNRTFSNQQGEREADFINCLVWRKQAENAANYLKKVNHKCIGKIFIVTWTDIRHDYDWLKPYVDRAIIFDAEEENPEYHQRVLN